MKTTVISENIVLGCLMNNLKWFTNCSKLKSTHFSKTINQALYNILEKFYINNVDHVGHLDIYAQFESDSQLLQLLQENGGIEYIEVISEVGTDSTLEQFEVHAQTVLVSAFKDECNQLLSALQCNLLSTKSKSISNIYNGIEEQLLSLKSRFYNAEHLTKIGNVLDNELAMLDKESTLTYCGFPTFSPSLNNFVTYERGECVVLSGTKKSGKSQFVVNEIYRLCIEGNIPCVVLDTELSTRFFLTRLLARITGYNIKYIKSGLWKNDANAKLKVESAIEKVRNAPLCHKFVVGMDERELTDELKRMKLNMNVQIVFYDYIKADVMSNKDMQERLQLAHMANWLKNEIAGTLNVSVVALTQTAIEYDKTKTIEPRIFGSNQVSMNVSTVMFLIKKSQKQIEEEYGSDVGGNYYIYVADNRNGVSFDDASKGINVVFNTGNCTMVEAQYQTESIRQLIQEQIREVQVQNE